MIQAAWHPDNSSTIHWATVWGFETEAVYSSDRDTIWHIRYPRNVIFERDMKNWVFAPVEQMYNFQ